MVLGGWVKLFVGGFPLNRMAAVMVVVAFRVCLCCTTRHFAGLNPVPPRPIVLRPLFRVSTSSFLSQSVSLSLCLCLALSIISESLSLSLSLPVTFSFCVVATCSSCLQPLVSCSGGCGAIYCSEDCRQGSWESGHSVLCLGLVTDERHPLVQHKVRVARLSFCFFPQTIPPSLFLYSCTPERLIPVKG